MSISRTVKECIVVSIVVLCIIGAVLVRYDCINRESRVAAVQPSLPDVVSKVIHNVIHVNNRTGQWQGSGVLIAPDLVLTARHIVEESEEFEIKTNDGKVYKAERAISSKKYDLGFIKLREKLPCTTAIGSMKSCRVGQSVFAIGSPYGDQHLNSVTAGIISGLDLNLEDYGLSQDYGWRVSFQTDAAGHPGNSGCPVYTMDGIVRGILVGGWSNALVYCIPAELVANDCQVVQLMFLMDEYQRELIERIPEWEYKIQNIESMLEKIQDFLNDRTDGEFDEFVYRRMQGDDPI